MTGDAKLTRVYPLFRGRRGRVSMRPTCHVARVFLLGLWHHFFLVFQFESQFSGSHTCSCYMKGTLLPLSVATRFSLEALF